MQKKKKKKKEKVFEVSYTGLKSQGEYIAKKRGLFAGKLATSHAPEQPLDAAALHDNAPTGNQAD